MIINLDVAADLLSIDEHRDRIRFRVWLAGPNDLSNDVGNFFFIIPKLRIKRAPRNQGLSLSRVRKANGVLASYQDIATILAKLGDEGRKESQQIGTRRTFRRHFQPLNDRGDF